MRQSISRGSPRLRILIGLVPVALVTIVVAGYAASELVAQGGSTRLREPDPELAQVLEDLPYLVDLIAAGEDVTIHPGGQVDAAAQPQMFGDFRITPAGYVGELHSVAVAQRPEDPGPPASTIAHVRASSLNFEPRAMVPGFRLADGRSPGLVVPAEIGVELVYTKGDEVIRIRRERIFELPVDLGYDPTSPVLSMRLDHLADGSPVAIYETWPTQEQIARGLPAEATIPEAYGYRSVTLYERQGHLVTTVESTAAPSVSTEDLIAILEGLR